MRSRALLSGFTATVITAMTCPIAQAQWQNHGQEAQQRAQQAQQQAQQRAQQAQQQAQQRQQEEQQRAQQAQQRSQQEAQQRAQQEQQHAQEAQQRAQQMQQQRAQEMQQRNQQMQQQRAQEMQQRNQQMQQQAAQRQQQEAQRQQQDAQRQQQAMQQKQQEAMQRAQQKQQEAMQRGQQHQQEAMQRGQQHQQDEMQRAQQRQQDNAQRAQQWQQQQGQRNQQSNDQRRQAEQQHQQFLDQQRNQAAQQHAIDRIQNPMKTYKFDKNLRRNQSLPPLRVPQVPIQKAFSMPNFESHASGDQLNRARLAQANMLKHLHAVPMNQAPRDFNRYRERELRNYYNNYRFNLNNRAYYINRQNTNYFPVQPSYYPSWYQPDPNWVYSNGFTLANAVNVGADWLGYGWQPYYGEAPTGFICARDYFPTPWVYEAATGQWRQPGLYAYTPGPDYDYTGPITVEVIEQVFAPGGQVVNVPYLYNAFFYPDQGRWAYENRQGYFIWLDV